MNTLRLFSTKDFFIPASTSWYLADLGEFRGWYYCFSVTNWVTRLDAISAWSD
jgi:hypothetical protein